jgi:hypothetical protein
VLSRGPVHEAYAQPFAADATPTPPAPKAPPPPIAEMPPDNKPDGPNVQWVSGYWSYDDERRDFIWVSGFWRAPPPGREWHDGQWVQDANGYRWVHGYWDGTDPGRAAQTLVQPPPDSLEQGASSPAPDENSIYVPGGWVASGAGYNWRPGYWTAGSDDWVWCPDQYYWTPTGYCYVSGYWDYPVAYRGELYAPVAFDTAVYATPGFTYSPGFVVGYGGLLHSLFVRPGYGSYYFGDYYSRNYRSAGYYPWFSYGTSHRRYDPLWTYHNWYYPRHGYTNWSNQYHRSYNARVGGAAPRPPWTFVQQSGPAQNSGTHIVSPASPARRHVGPPNVIATVQGPTFVGPQTTSQFRGPAQRLDVTTSPQLPGPADVNPPRVINLAPPQNRVLAPAIANAAAPASLPTVQAPQVQFRQGPSVGIQSFRPAPNVGGGRPMPNVGGGRPNSGGSRPTPGGGHPSSGHSTGSPSGGHSSGGRSGGHPSGARPGVHGRQR